MYNHFKFTRKKCLSVIVIWSNLTLKPTAIYFIYLFIFIFRKKQRGVTFTFSFNVKWSLISRTRTKNGPFYPGEKEIKLIHFVYLSFQR